MGHFADFRCRGCRYEEVDLGVGHGRKPTPVLKLFRCDHCHSVGSTWVQEGRVTRCSFCYHDEPVLLADDVTALACPKCQAPGVVTHRRDATWE